MRKNYFVALAVLASVVCLAGCGAESQKKENGVPTGTPTNVSASMPTNTPTDVSAATMTNTPTSMPTSAPTQSAADLFTTVEDKVINSENITGSQIITENTENTRGEAYNALNSKMSGASSPSLFCMDEAAGITYFVNQGQDWYIYAIKEGEVALAVELPAQELTVWNGKLYFIVNDYEEYELAGMQSGDIYVYTPETGAVELVYAAGEKTDKQYVSSSELAVTEEGVYFQRATGMEVMEYNGQKFNVLQIEDMLLPHGATEPVEDKLQMTTPGWKEYRFSGGTYQELVKREEGNRTDAARKETGIQTKNCAVIGDELFYSTAKEVGSVHLETGEKKSFLLDEFLLAMEGVKEVNLKKSLNVKEITKENEEVMLPAINDFTVTKEDIWCVLGFHELVQINRETGEMKLYLLEGERLLLRELYTDGEEIYGVQEEAGISGMTCLVKLLTKQEKKLHKIYQLPMVEMQRVVQ